MGFPCHTQIAFCFSRLGFPMKKKESFTLKSQTLLQILSLIHIKSEHFMIMSRKIQICDDRPWHTLKVQVLLSE